MKASDEMLVRTKLAVIEAELKEIREVFPREDGDDEFATMARSCQGKRRYVTPDGAGDAAIAASRKSGDKLRVYTCTFCQGYHLTKTTLEDVVARLPVSQPGWTGRAAFGAARGVHTADEARRPALGTGNGIWRKRIQLGKGARGVHRAAQQLPDLSGDSGAAGRGIHASALIRKLPHVHGNAGTQGVRTKTTSIGVWFETLADRLRRVRVCCGEWDRILGPSPTTHIGLTGVFLDPPSPLFARAAARAAEVA